MNADFSIQKAAGCISNFSYDVCPGVNAPPLDLPGDKWENRLAWICLWPLSQHASDLSSWDSSNSGGLVPEGADGVTHRVSCAEQGRKEPSNPGPTQPWSSPVLVPPSLCISSWASMVYLLTFSPPPIFLPAMSHTHISVLLLLLAFEFPPSFPDLLSLHLTVPQVSIAFYSFPCSPLTYCFCCSVK